MKTKILAAILIAAMTGGAAAQEQQTSSKKKSMLWGAGLGAVAGGIIGGHGSSALIGAAVGTGVGYVVGNEQDKKKAQQMSEQSKQNNYSHTETGPFAGTSWRLQDWSPKSGKEDFKAKTFAFGKNGSVKTTTTYKDGRSESYTENYRVVDNTLIVNKGDYLVNYKYTLKGDLLTVDAEKVRAILKRT